MIKNALILGILGFFVVFGVLLLSDVLSKSNSQNVIDMVSNNYISMAKFLSFIIRESVEMEDEIGTSAVLNMFKSHFKDVVSLTIISNDGTILADLDSTKLLSKFKGTMVGNKEFLKVTEGERLYLGIPVKTGNQKLGEIHFTLDNKKYTTKITTFDINKIIYSGAALVVFFIIGLFVGKGGKKEGVIVAPDTSGLSSEIETLKQVISNLKKEEEDTIKMIEDKKAEIERIEKEIKNKKKELATIDSEFGNIVDKRKEIESLRSELSAIEVKLADKKSELEEVEKKLQDIKRKVPLENEEEALIGGLINDNIDSRIEEKKKQEVELTQRIVAKRREEITISARIEAKKKELLELEKKIDSLKKQA